MRASLIIFGVIFLVIGGMFYFVPIQHIKADTITTGNGETDIRTSSANVTVPIEWTYASAIIGFVLLIFGLAIPGPAKVKVVPGPRGPRGRSFTNYKKAPPIGTSTTTTTTRVNR